MEGAANCPPDPSPQPVFSQGVPPPGTAEHLATVLTARGRTCPHFPQVKCGEDSGIPSRLGFFHVSKDAVAYLETKKLCVECYKTAVPDSINVWSSGLKLGDNRRDPQLHYTTVVEAGTEDTGIGSKLPLPEHEDAEQSWHWLLHEKKPFYIDQLHLATHPAVRATKKAGEDSAIAQKAGIPFDKAVHAKGFVGSNVETEAPVERKTVKKKSKSKESSSLATDITPLPSVTTEAQLDDDARPAAERSGDDESVPKESLRGRADTEERKPRKAKEKLLRAAAKLSSRTRADVIVDGAAELLKTQRIKVSKAKLRRSSDSAVQIEEISEDPDKKKTESKDRASKALALESLTRIGQEDVAKGLDLPVDPNEASRDKTIKARKKAAAQARDEPQFEASHALESPVPKKAKSRSLDAGGIADLAERTVKDLRESRRKAAGPRDGVKPIKKARAEQTEKKQASNDVNQPVFDIPARALPDTDRSLTFAGVVQPPSLPPRQMSAPDGIVQSTEAPVSRPSMLQRMQTAPVKPKNISSLGQASSTLVSGLGKHRLMKAASNYGKNILETQGIPKGFISGPADSGMDKAQRLRALTTSAIGYGKKISVYLPEGG